MASYSEMIAQIEELKRQAEKQRKEEYSTVLKTIKRQIAEYGISAKELGFSSAAATRKLGRKEAGLKEGRERGQKTGSRGRHPLSGSKVPPRYRDQDGNTWTGRGKQPKWVVAALAAGHSLDSLIIR